VGRLLPPQPSRESFEALLGALGPDRDCAGERYEAMRQRLLRFFRHRGARAPDALTDETFDRVGRRLAGGEIIQTRDVARYFLGVAHNVMREAWERERRQMLALPAESVSGRDAWRRCLEPEDPALPCLLRCLDALRPETRELLLRYYELEGRARIDQRRELASRLGIAPNALRIQMHRLRAGLEECVRGRLATTAERPLITSTTKTRDSCGGRGPARPAGAAGPSSP